MAPSPGGKLAELLAAAEKKKRDAQRARLGLPAGSAIDGLELDSLSYHLTERSGPVHVRLDASQGCLRVGDEPGAPGLAYRGEAIEIALRWWGLTREEAARGCRLELDRGKRVDAKA